MTDTERLDCLEKQDGAALISDDQGHWAVSFVGMQSVPEKPPEDIWTEFFIEKKQWRNSIREAIDVMITEIEND